MFCILHVLMIKRSLFWLGMLNRSKTIHGLDPFSLLRIPREVAEQGYGYLEDRRPSSNCDPYKVSRVTTILKSGDPPPTVIPIR